MTDASDRAVRRRENFARMRDSFPLPIVIDDIPLPGGRLGDDEFVVRTAKEWHVSTNPLILTTAQLICPLDPSARDVAMVPLAEIREVRLRKPFIGYATVIIEAATGRFSFAAHINGERIRADIALMVEAVQATTTLSSADRYERLRQLGELKASGVLTEAEFEQEKARILRQP